jgi:hypothetical protein
MVKRGQTIPRRRKGIPSNGRLRFFGQLLYVNKEINGKRKD